MKKLMITVAAATMVSGAFAVNKAQVYDFTATLKTTGCKAAKVSSQLEKYFQHNSRGWSNGRNLYSKGDEIGLRKQVSVKIAGVIWGCDCPTIAVPGWRYTDVGASRSANKYIGGYLFWNEKSETLYNPLPNGLGGYHTEFDWFVLNRIDTMTKCEGSFWLKNDVQGQAMFLVGSGFGSVKNTGCDTYASSIKGSLAGFRLSPDDEFGCVFCAAEGCTAMPFCDTCWDDEFGYGHDTTNYSVAHGSWSIKYNSSAAKKLSATPFLSRVYKFGKKSGDARAVLAAIEALAWNAAGNVPRMTVAGDDDEDEEDWEWHGGDAVEDFDMQALIDELDPDDASDAKILNVLTPYIGAELDETVLGLIAELVDLAGDLS